MLQHTRKIAVGVFAYLLVIGTGCAVAAAFSHAVDHVAAASSVYIDRSASP